MPGGTWTLENKIRPGAYVNFATQGLWNESMPGGGVVVLPYEMSWGAEHEAITVYATDMLNGNVRTLLGYPSDHIKILAVAEALKNCSKVLVYRVNGGGNKAATTLGSLAVTAKYSGSRGNDLKVGVFALAKGFAVVTYLEGEEVDRQTLADGEAPLENDWVTFTLNDTLVEAVVTSLSGGTDGVSTTADYESCFSAMKTKAWQVMVLPKEDESLSVKVVAYIKDMRETQGKKVQGVVCNYAPDYEGIIQVKQGYVRNGVTVAVENFAAWVGGATAGAAIHESNTYQVIPDADSIVPEYTPEEIEEQLKNGVFLLGRRTDGTVVVEQDINSLVTFSSTKNSIFRKNRVLRTLDKIANGVANLFDVNYIGTMNNNAEGRDLFKQDIIGFMNDLMAVGAIEDFDGAEDVVLSRGQAADSVVVTLGVCPVDAMEKLYMTVEVES